MDLLPVSIRHDVYQGLDPEPYYNAQMYAGKVILITGASRGIGKEMAIQYAKSGATLSLLARNMVKLEELKALIRTEIPSVRLELFVVDVSDTGAINAAVKRTFELFGGINIVIANAGVSLMQKNLTEEDPSAWWNAIKINLGGVFNAAHSTLPLLAARGGYFVAVTSIAGHTHVAQSAAYCVSKTAVNRLVQVISAEEPNVKVFALDPGDVQTDMTLMFPRYTERPVDTLRLPACAALRLTSGRDDWLSGRFVSVNWDMDEVEKLKDRILKENALVPTMSRL